ncbi:MAG: hypothetical protein ABWY19_15890, partial [Marmoricola sp.]
MSEVSIRDWFGNLSLPSLRPRERTTGEPAGSSTIQRYWPVLALVVVQALIAFDVDLPVLRPILALATMLGLPTLVLVRRAGIATDGAAARVVYAFGVSLVGLLLVALVLNTVLPVVGIDHPLHPVVLAITWLVIDLGLLAWRADIPLLPAYSMADSWRRMVDARFETAQTLAVAALLLAVVGAIRLNNGEGGTIAVLAQALAAATLVALMVRPEASL